MGYGFQGYFTLVGGAGVWENQNLPAQQGDFEKASNSF
jgi:hypothetical protein